MCIQAVHIQGRKIVMAGISTNPVCHCPSLRVLLKVLVKFNTVPYITLANILKEMILVKGKCFKINTLNLRLNYPTHSITSILSSKIYCLHNVSN